MPWDSSLGRWWAKLTIGTLQSAYAAKHAHAPDWRSALAGDAYRYFFNNLEHCATKEDLFLHQPETKGYPISHYPLSAVLPLITYAVQAQMAGIIWKILEFR